MLHNISLSRVDDHFEISVLEWKGQEQEQCTTTLSLKEMHDFIEAMQEQALSMLEEQRNRAQPDPEEADSLAEKSESDREDTEAVEVSVENEKSKALGPRQVDPIDIGTMVDIIAHNSRRAPTRVAQRVLEECVELCLATGMTAAQIYNGVADSIHNQCVKASTLRTVFPSQYQEIYDRPSIIKEIADVRLVLLDLMHVCGSIKIGTVDNAIRAKFNKLKGYEVSDFVSDGHTFYLKKAHISTQATQ